MFSKDQQDQNAALLDMDMQQEEVMAFFRDYWKPILAIAIALVVLTAGVQIYRNVDARIAGEQTAALLPLASAPPTAESAKALEDFAANKATGGGRAIALLFAASKYQLVSKPDDVKRVLTQITESSAPEEIKSYARLLLVNAGGDPKLLDQIGKNSAWQTAIAEVHALAQTDPEKQRDAYAVIAVDPKAPPGLHERAAELSGQTGAE